jgi:hypothetical protein
MEAGTSQAGLFIGQALPVDTLISRYQCHSFSPNVLVNDIGSRHVAWVGEWVDVRGCHPAWCSGGVGSGEAMGAVTTLCPCPAAPRTRRRPMLLLTAELTRAKPRSAAFLPTSPPPSSPSTTAPCVNCSHHVRCQTSFLPGLAPHLFVVCSPGALIPAAHNCNCFWHVASACMPASTYNCCFRGATM